MASNRAGLSSSRRHLAASCNSFRVNAGSTSAVVGSRGFTLVELLVVIAIIGVLVALLLPAVQAAREAARRANCVSNLRNVGIATLNHVDVQGHYPSNGWGSLYTADPDQGFGKNQPGSWLFSILPYIELQALHDIGSGSPGWPVPVKKKRALLQTIQTPVPVFYCPSRRPALAYPVKQWSSVLNFVHDGSDLARNDYAACSGSGSTIAGLTGTSRYFAQDYNEADTFTGWPNPELYNGISFIRSEVALREVTDGTSNTYFVGEKSVNVDAYNVNGEASVVNLADHGDDQGWLIGHNGDTVRSSGSPPLQDTLGVNPYEFWGSAHPGGFNMMFGDSSVKTINYEIDLVTHAALGTRNGAEVAATP
ncbi:DUF1559 domain-containing protein [Lacipirellula parvula]|uniref:DUF1559 domain-containing protein n=1 Tax=Lacipirellula parvula TaxID=2650471 RepID=A0A5K7X914_9BACT|nr:DUF1559 domain-containing protein [Lacipirellula parvula]BBO32835.1 hypothetical protein PLANPX_2447 [Lacipirellula parvula]